MAWVCTYKAPKGSGDLAGPLALSQCCQDPRVNGTFADNKCSFNSTASTFNGTGFDPSYNSSTANNSYETETYGFSGCMGGGQYSSGVWFCDNKQTGAHCEGQFEVRVCSTPAPPGYSAAPRSMKIQAAGVAIVVVVLASMVVA